MFLFAKLKRWITEPVESMALQVPRALIASVLALVVDFCVLECLVRVLGLPGVFSAVVGYLAGGVLQYVLCSLWVFSTPLRNDPAGFAAFTLLSLVGLAITWVVVAVGHDGIGMPIEMAKCLAISLAFTWNFLSRKYLLFRSASAAILESDSVQPKI